MADRIKLFPYASTPNGIEVCFTRNSCKVEVKRFPAGTSREAILAELTGQPLPAEDLAAKEAARLAAEKQQRADASQPVTTPNEDDLKKQDGEHDAELQELNVMRSALKEASVSGYQLFPPDVVRKKYAELMEAKKAEADEAADNAAPENGEADAGAKDTAPAEQKAPAKAKNTAKPKADKKAKNAKAGADEVK